MKIEGIWEISNKENLKEIIDSPEMLQEMINHFYSKKHYLDKLDKPSESVASLKNTSHEIKSIRIERSKLPRKKKKLLKKKGQYENWKNNRRILNITIGLIYSESSNVYFTMKKFL